MNKYISLFFLLGIFAFSSCSDELNTSPSESISEDVLFSDVSSAKAAIEGVYRLMYTSGFATAWEHENPGYSTTVLTGDLFGEDHVQKGAGQGWFWYDYQLDIAIDYQRGSYGHPYFFWNFYYTIISNVNYILSYEDTLKGDETQVKELMAQAYAMRAFSYFYLIQLYQQTYVGNQDKPGVPVYTEPTTKETEGKPRGTVEQTYTQINKDIDEAIRLFTETGMNPHSDASHIDYYVANGIKARICMVQHRYQDALDAAKEALKATYSKIATVKEMDGMNDSNNPNVLWAADVIADQGSGYAGFFSHMDADAAGLYASKAPHLISSQLYDMLSDTDERKLSWFTAPDVQPGSGSKTPYCQIKFRFSDYSSMIGDIIFMRYEEMLLVKAEAECMLEDYINARNTIKSLMENRDAEGYEAVLDGVTDSNVYSPNTNSQPTTLIEEILLQRRIELWGEVGRLYDLKRLGLGYSRGGNHSVKLDAEVNDIRFALPIPQTEIDGNENISDADQNPM